MLMHLLLAPLLVLYFDGSFTPPASSRSSPSPSSSSSSFASCGAVILYSDDDRYDGSARGHVTDLGGGGFGVLAVGGRVILPSRYDEEDDDDDWGLGVSGRTSASAEYEGLLLGLRFVLDGLTDGTLSLSPTSTSTSTSVPPLSAHSFRGYSEASTDDDGRLEEASSLAFLVNQPRGVVAGGQVPSPALPPEEGVRCGRAGDERCGPSRLVIRGDCRTVVDQLNGSSIPRRLRRQHARATELLDRIRRHADDSSVDSDNGDDDVRGPALRIDVELVPRDRNSLADAVAREAGAVVRRDAIRRVRDCIGPSSSPLEGAGMGRRHLSEALDLIAGRCGTVPVPVPINVRIALLREVAETAWRVGDASTLESAGSALRGEARILPTGGKRTRDGAGSSRSVDRYTRGGVEADGLRLEIVAMRMMGREGEAERYERRHRYKLRGFPAKTDDVLLSWDGAEAGGPLLDSQRSDDSSSDPSRGDAGNFAGLLRSWSSEASAKMERLVSREGVFLVL